MRRTTTPRTALGAAIVLAAVLVLACQGDPATAPQPPNAPGGLASMMTTCPSVPDSFPGAEGGLDGEGEIYGSIYDNEVRICTDENDLITLEPDSPLGPFEADLVPNNEFTHMWEFWDTNADDGPCRHTPRPTEVAHAPYAQYEEHCVAPGRHYFIGPKPGGGTREFYVDYLKVIAAQVADATKGGMVAVAAYPGQTGVSLSFPNDLVIHTELSATSFADTARLYVDATQNPDGATFTHSSSINVDSSFTFRASASWSGAEWHGHDHGRYLARLHYKVGAGSWAPIPGLNFYAPLSESTRILRKFKLSGPTGCPTSAITYTIGLEIMQPNESPSTSPSADTSAQRTITVSCPSGISPLDTVTIGAASAIGHTSATINWTNGTTSTGVTTYVQFQENASNSWTSAPSSPYTASTTASVNVTGLAAGTVYDVRAWHDSAGIRSDTTVAIALFTTTVPAPTSLNSTGVGATSATVTWSNSLATTGTTTEVEYKSSGSYTAATPAATAGATSKLLSGLSTNTTYDVRIRHVRNGQASSWLEALDLFTTDDEPPPPTFSWVGCDRYYSVGKWRIKHNLGWSGATGSWQVREATVNDTTSGNVIASGSLGTSMWTGEYLEIYDPLYSYFWVKVAGSAWTPLGGNPLLTTSCEA